MVNQQSPDWNAFCALQKLHLKSISTFYLEASDYAMDKCLASSKRKAKGLQLSKDLLRDGRRAACWVNKITDFNQDLHLPIAITSADDQEELQPAEKYTGLLFSFLNTIPDREKEILILSLKGVTYQQATLQKYTKVSARTFRYILTAIRGRIRANPALKHAFYLAIRVWGYTANDFIALIKHK